MKNVLTAQSAEQFLVGSSKGKTGAARTVRFDGEFWVAKSRVYRQNFLGRREIISSLNLPAHLEYTDNAGKIWDHAYLRSNCPPDSQYSSKRLRGADLFCGCGGLTLGVQEACRALGINYSMAYAIDTDEWALNVYKRNFPRAKIEHGDIVESLDGKLAARITKSERDLLKRTGNINIVVAGPPCQGHSNLNNRTRRNDERNRLYERVGRFAEISNPDHILVENVPSIVHARDRTMEKTANHLVKIGYSVDHGVVDLLLLGVPQRRKRHVLIASANRSVNIKEIVDATKLQYQTTVKWAIADLEGYANGILFDSPADISPENRSRINYLFRNKKFDLPNKLRPICHQNDNHSYYSMYGRLKGNEPALTVTTGFHSPGQGRYIHFSRPRTLTPHEAARLQFFPDFFDFSDVPFRKALAQMIGNAVPMKLSYVFAFALLKGNS